MGGGGVGGVGGAFFFSLPWLTYLLLYIFDSLFRLVFFLSLSFNSGGLRKKERVVIYPLDDFRLMKGLRKDMSPTKEVASGGSTVELPLVARYLSFLPNSLTYLSLIYLHRSLASSTAPK